MNQLVRFSVNDDGDEVNETEWCLVDPENPQGAAKLCTAEFFGRGESEAVYEEKTVKRGGITCKRCLEILKTYKAVRL